MQSLNKIASKNILVIGDVMLDTYFIGDVERISPEAPVPVFKKKSERNTLGGAANVAMNLTAAGQRVSVMTVVGKDVGGRELKSKLQQNGIQTDLVLEGDRCTTVKTRFLASNNQQVMRLDVEETQNLGNQECDKLLRTLDENIKNYDLILLSDYCKGLLTYAFTQRVIKIASAHSILVIVDVKDPKVEKYNGAFLLKPNLNEVRNLTGLPAETNSEIIEASERLRDRCHCKYVLTTCGSRGMVLVGDEKPLFIESVAQEVFDVTGAGDTTIAYLAACMANGFRMRESVEIANYAAGIQVKKVGTSAVYWSEVRELLADKKQGSLHKLLSIDVIASFRNEHKNKKIVFTNGCFDILHIGHVRYLQEAAKLGDILIIGLNSDASVKRLKGEDRPINSEKDRAELLCTLGFIDYVVIFEEDTPLELIKLVQPDILVKGGDYFNKYVVGTREVESRGGKLILLPFVDGKSTTNIINKIKQ